MVLALPIGLLFRRAPRTSPVTDDTGTLRIRCPMCGWQPSKHDRWMCNPGCGHLWNTFDTRGVCPGCAKGWRHTACHACQAWSLHDAWYEPAAPR